jgi:uncharacterized protein (TIGR02246 family)
MASRDSEVARAIALASASLDQALMGPDAERVAAHFTADGVLGESGMHDLIGRTAIRDFLAAANAVRTVTFHRLYRDELEILGDRAIELGRFDETKVRPGQAPVYERGRTVTYWRREPDGAWRISRLVVSDLPATSLAP